MSTSNDASFEKKDVSRYSEQYLNGKTEEIVMTDPIIVIYNICDEAKLNKGNIYICNREPSDHPFRCECKSDIECSCDDDDSVEVELTCDIVSNCRCNLDVRLKQNLKLSKDFYWNVFILSEDGREKKLLMIDPINSCFYINHKGASYKFLTDAITYKHGHIGSQFSYMEYELVE